MNCNDPEDVQLPKLEPLNCYLFSLSATMVTTLWLRQTASLCSACIRSLFKWVKDKLWERLFCVGLESNLEILTVDNLSDKIVNGLPEPHLNPTESLRCKWRQSHSHAVNLIETPQLVVYRELGSGLLTPLQIAQHANIHVTDCARKIKYTPMRTDLSREHIAFKLSCMVHCKNKFS